MTDTINARVSQILHQGYLDAHPDLVARLTASRERQREAEEAQEQDERAAAEGAS